VALRHNSDRHQVENRRVSNDVPNGNAKSFAYKSDRNGFRNVIDRDAADIYLLGESILVAGLVPFDKIITSRLEKAMQAAAAVGDIPWFAGDTQPNGVGHQVMTNAVAEWVLVKQFQVPK
jgi:hypothetical protein